MFNAVARGRATASSLFRRRLLPQTSPKFITMAPVNARQQSTLPAGYKEDHAKGAMLRFEDSLPRLPVPTLEETAKRYLKSVHPLLSKPEFDATTKAVNDFVAPGGPGETLQKRLIARREDPNVRNWIFEWWNDAAYMAYRDPVVPYVSYFYSHRDDRKRRNPAKRAAAISTAVLEFKKSVDSGSLEPEYMKKLPMAMSSYEWMFNCSRVPKKPSDTSVKYPAEGNAHILVIRKNQFWKIPHEINGQQLNTSELELQFQRIYEKAEKSAPIGVLTSQNRDVWTDVYQRLSASDVNKSALQAIESASFVVCLDDASPVTLEERAHQYWHGDGSNRWFDKPLQFIVNDNGTSGFMGEHSMMDGTPTHRLNDYTNELIFTNALDFDNPNVRSSLPTPTPIRFELSAELKTDVEAAQQHFARQIGAHELRVQAYQGYGKGLIKKFKCSPDAYVQMIIQLAYHKFYGKNRPTYESAATRRFQQGRTETCRTVSDESVAFCNAMADHSVAPEQAQKLFRDALNAHVKYISDASDGRGVDRHLFGLKKCLKEGEDVPGLYKDPAYSYSSSWYISSSQLSSEYFNGYGWSQVIDDGWGIAYMINENSLQFNIVSKGLGSVSLLFSILRVY
ncbi:acyltransferase ChoActase/COT/CPT [Lophium mytilinum]|uniref:Carnitine O-acetyltransferase, mitochondrial n=1 Tax=Lophium mytilinum TaxID=390894 RepID=A0A6A6RE70_9PEZI|nr:acyltransferase ChoActase/COT/CPT [Lophium mytilinum]